MMCFRCSSRGNYGLHHIDGSGNSDDPNDNPNNLIPTCPTCHDYIQGFCDKCTKQPFCNRKTFLECWEFEEAIPPIHFRLRKKEEILESESAKCPECGSEKIVRISKWYVPIASVYNNNTQYHAIYHCKKCHAEFKRKLNKPERAWDNHNIPIEITDWNLSANI